MSDGKPAFSLDNPGEDETEKLTSLLSSLSSEEPGIHCRVYRLRDGWRGPWVYVGRIEGVSDLDPEYVRNHWGGGSFSIRVINGKGEIRGGAKWDILGAIQPFPDSPASAPVSSPPAVPAAPAPSGIPSGFAEMFAFMQAELAATRTQNLELIRSLSTGGASNASASLKDVFLMAKELGSLRGEPVDAITQLTQSMELLKGLAATVNPVPEEGNWMGVLSKGLDALTAMAATGSRPSVPALVAPGAGAPGAGSPPGADPLASIPGYAVTAVNGLLTQLPSIPDDNALVDLILENVPPALLRSLVFVPDWERRFQAINAEGFAANAERLRSLRILLADACGADLPEALTSKPDGGKKSPVPKVGKGGSCKAPQSGRGKGPGR